MEVFSALCPAPADIQSQAPGEWPPQSSPLDQGYQDAQLQTRHLPRTALRTDNTLAEGEQLY